MKSKREFMSKRNPRPTTPLETTLHPRLLENGYVSFKQCRHGLFMYNVNDLYIGRSLDIYGEWSEAELACLAQILKVGDVVIDVGANIGTHTVFFSKKVAPGGMVYAFEPQRGTFEFLCANLALNGLLNVIPIHAGAGDCLGEIIVPVLDPSIAQNFAGLNIEGHPTGNLVKMLPLDALELQRCNLIKIDVEGMELKVLHGAEKTIRNCRPFLFVENHAREGSPEMLQMLSDLNYNCWWHIASYYNSDNFFQNPEKVWANAAPEANMICVPKEIDLNITGFEPVINVNDTFLQALSRMGLIKT
jgi:FkbM family methyltransferase